MTPATATPRIAVAVAAVAGVCGAAQPKVNAVLATRAGSALLAGLVNFTAAFAVVLAVLASRRATRDRVLAVRRWKVPRWTFTAGLCGALIATSAALAVQTIGVAIFSVAFFAGQISFGLAVDRTGAGPGDARPLSRPRVGGAALALVAVGISQAGRDPGAFAPALVALVVVAGAALAWQSACNGRITQATGDAFAATAVNVSIGLVALGALVGVLRGAGTIDAPAWPAQPWLYAGGLLGVTIVASLAATTPVLGVLRATLTMLAAQLVTAFAVDWATTRQRPLPGAVAGAALIVVAAALVGRSPSRAGALADGAAGDVA